MIILFLLHDIPRRPDTRLFEVREGLKRSLLLGFQAHIHAYIAFFPPPALRETRLASLRATDAEPLIK